MDARGAKANGRVRGRKIKLPKDAHRLRLHRKSQPESNLRHQFSSVFASAFSLCIHPPLGAFAEANRVAHTVGFDIDLRTEKMIQYNSRREKN